VPDHRSAPIRGDEHQKPGTSAKISTPKKPRFTDTTASVLLDAVRGIAAILVLLEHWRNALFVDFPQIHAHRVLMTAVYLLCAAGHQAVVIFFVLSGYLISGSVLRAFKRNEWSWAQYLTHRLVRLWIVLLPALVFGACWDQLGIHSHQAAAMYSGANYNHITPNVAHALSFTTFIGNAAFLQSILVPTFGSNGALWSLANEFWYYILFPLAACVIGRVYKKLWQALICGLLFCGVAIFVTKAILFLFPVWLFGALLHAVKPRANRLWFRIVASAAYAVAFFGSVFVQRRGWFGQGVTNDLILGVITFGFIWILLGAVQEAKQTRVCKLSRATARFSFTLYVAHTPILICLTALVAHDARWVPTLKSGGLAFIVLIVVVAYAWLLATLTEFRTDQVRAWAEGIVMRRVDAGQA
jgi:peptidoglycan/LPS O-acetylase OafA/YrhL